MSGNVHGGFPKKISVPEIFGKLGPNWAQNRPFQIFLKIGSKDFLDILHMIRGHYCAHFAENRMFSKILVSELWTEKTKKQGIFKGSYLEYGTSYRKSDSIFGILRPFLQKMPRTDFPYLDPFTLKIESEHRNRKKSQFWFFDFLEFRSSDFLHIAQ